MRAILVDAAAVANATARAVFFQTRVADNFLYEGSYWKRGFFGGDYQFLLDGGGNERNLDARTAFFYMATVNTPAMAMKMVGRGSQYAVLSTATATATTSTAPTRTASTSRPTCPAKDFWSVVVYDPQTRSELQTDNRFPSKNNHGRPHRQR